MTEQEFVQELANVLNEDAAALRGDAQLESLAGWDSAGLLGVIAFLDGELGVVIDVDKLRACKTVSDLLSLARSKLG